MQNRRRKVSSGAGAVAPDESCNLEDTTSEDERFAGDPNEEPVDAVPPPTPPPPDKSKDFAMPWGMVITDVFKLDVHATFKQLSTDLELGTGATEYGTVLAAVDRSARNLFRAACLARAAKLEDLNFAASLDVRLEVLRTAAVQALEQDKRAGVRSKAPTLQDIEDRMLSAWPDEVRDLRNRKEKMHGAFRAIEALEVAWRERCQALRVIAQQFKSSGA